MPEPITDWTILYTPKDEDEAKVWSLELAVPESDAEVMDARYRAEFEAEGHEFHGILPGEVNLDVAMDRLVPRRRVVMVTRTRMVREKVEITVNALSPQDAIERAEAEIEEDVDIDWKVTDSDVTHGPVYGYWGVDYR